MASGSFESRVALVTGAGKGIGAAVAARLSAEGARVVFADIDLANAERAAQLAGDDAIAEYVDVADETSVSDLFRRLRDKNLLPDILVNAAGVIGGDTPETATRESMDAVFSVNVYGGVFMMKHAAAEMMRRGRGKIINLASVAISTPSKALSYAASKHAVVGVTRSAALAFAPHGIQVNAIAPGQVDTPMWRAIVEHQRGALAAQGGDPDSFEAEILSAIPAARIATTQDICGLAMYLASSASDYMTGQTLGINGGLAMN